MRVDNYIMTSGITEAEKQEIINSVLAQSTTPQLEFDPLISDFSDTSTPKLWINTTEGITKYWNGSEIKEFDTRDGELLDAFGNPTGIDI